MIAMEKPIYFIIVDKYIDQLLSNLDKRINIRKYKDAPYIVVYRILTRADLVGTDYITITGHLDDNTSEFGNIVVTFGTGPETYNWKQCGTINVTHPEFESKFIDIMDYAIKLLFSCRK